MINLFSQNFNIGNQQYISKNQPNNNAAKKLLQGANYDTVAFSSSGKRCANDMIAYYKQTGIKYTPKSKEECKLEEAIAACLKLDDTDDVQTTQNRLIQFQDACNELHATLLEDDDELSTFGETAQKVFFFCSLVEGFDNLKSKSAASMFNAFLFDTFLEEFGQDEDIQDALKIYAKSDILKNDIFKSRLARQINS